ncbi:MAG TPA: SDR family NAD(P)-dependent oxidoreductase, partial [Verrucomicrobiae bacterium]|nr:SDR family NAD(P)-dependent oxidoreductase [Verrucomicrobiae bacterium]
HLFLKPMIARRRGRILNVASTAAFQPGPCISVYYASKAFVHSFSYALAQEVESSGITVTALCPGTTRTDFFARGQFSVKRAPFTMHARDVAEAGYRGVMRGKRVVIPGLHNRIAARFSKFLPLAITSIAVRKLHAKR